MCAQMKLNDKLGTSGPFPFRIVATEIIERRENTVIDLPGR